ncbi:MAG: NAD-dependent epimerase/dehydratase family protein [Henriciella sp.]
MHFIVTGVAGFIGSQVAAALLDQGHAVVGIDNLNDYYAIQLKHQRLENLRGRKGFRFEKMDLADHQSLLALPERDEIDRVVHLAAQAGVRYSLENPFAYAASNLTGHLSVLEFCRHAAKKPFLAYASSSSVYGDDVAPPFDEDAQVDQPVSLYAATKRADELMSSSYAKLYGIEQVGMRFFTVYGPWGRPDMAYWSFTEKILKGDPIQVFNGGQMKRDFTYIDDAVSGILSIALNDNKLAELERPHGLYNIGHNQPVALLDFIAEIERATGQKAEMVLQPMQPGDVTQTCANIDRMKADYNYTPKISLRDGIGQFVDWFQNYNAQEKPVSELVET